MDDQDHLLQRELESLAGNAYNPSDPTNTPAEPISTTLTRWTNLFNIPPDSAIDLIMSHRNNLTRTRISDEHWSSIRADREAQGYDREAHEYELELQKRKANVTNLLPVDEDVESRMTFLVEVNGLLSSVEAIRKAAGLEEMPQTVDGWSVEEKREVEMCIVGSREKKAILQWAAEEGGGFEPTILVNPKSMQ